MNNHDSFEIKSENVLKRCSVCGKEFNVYDLQENFVIHKSYLGYGTVHDGGSLCIELCCDCMDDLISKCVNNPVEELEAIIDTLTDK